MKGSLKTLALAATMLAGAAIPAEQASGMSKSDVVYQRQPGYKLESARRNHFGGFSGSSDKPSRFLNQRQYRKHCRQNPCAYRSKKHRSRNK